MVLAYQKKGRGEEMKINRNFSQLPLKTSKRHLQNSEYIWKFQFLVCVPLGYKVLSQFHYIFCSDRPCSHTLHIWGISLWNSMAYFQIL